MFAHPEFAKRIVVTAGIAAAVAPFFAWAIYGGAEIWPGLVGNFTASLLAFLCALAWDRRERQRERVQEEEDRTKQQAEEDEEYVRRLEEARARELDQRRSEAKRRFSLILKELQVNGKSLDDARGSLAYKIVLPQLLDGSWIASGAALSSIASDYELVAELSTFYGRINELRWRLRRRLDVADPGAQQLFDAMIEPLINEMRGEVAGLIKRVSTESEEPGVIDAPFIPPAPTVVFAPAVSAASAATRRVTRGSGARS